MVGCTNTSFGEIKMSNRDIGQEILDGIQEAKAYKAGQGNLRTHTLKQPSAPPGYSGKAAIISGRFCRSDGRQPADGTRLGTRAS